jgi:hypothetical protein
VGVTLTCPCQRNMFKEKKLRKKHDKFL